MLVSVLSEMILAIRHPMLHMISSFSVEISTIVIQAKCVYLWCSLWVVHEYMLQGPWKNHTSMKCITIYLNWQSSYAPSRICQSNGWIPSTHHLKSSYKQFHLVCKNRYAKNHLGHYHQQILMKTIWMFEFFLNVFHHYTCIFLMYYRICTEFCQRCETCWRQNMIWTLRAKVVYIPQCKSYY